MRRMQKARNFINAVKGHGCSVALDDFGNGMASFRYSKNFAVDFVKIDGSLIQEIGSDSLSHAVVESIHNVARVLEVGTIADQVGEQDVADVLESIGIDYVQGDVIAGPEAFSLH